MYPRHRLDVSTRDLLFGLSACLWARRDKPGVKIARACSTSPEELLVCLSVRSGLDLLLGTLALPAGSEVLVSAVTHPDMVRIIEGHGLRAIPVDLDLETLSPRIETLERALTTRARAILIAHLFGARADLTPIAGVARKHDLLLLEDCAQSFRGPHHPGDPRADVSMFSFGAIKTASAAGGALFYVRDPVLREGMRRAQESWSVQRRWDYARKLFGMLGFLLLGRPFPYRVFVRLCGLLGRDLDALLNDSIRSFPDRAPVDELVDRIRRRPSAPLLALLARRLTSFDMDRLARRAATGEEVARRLPPVLPHPGRSARERTHWLFPVLAPDPQELVKALRRRGFDASRATSNIAAVRATPDATPEAAAWMISNVVFLPVYPELPDEALVCLIRYLIEATLEERA